MKNQANDRDEFGRTDLNSAVDSAAETFEDLGKEAKHAANRAAEGVRDQFSGIVDHFRGDGVQEMMDDVTKYVKSHPAQALIGAAVLGFVAGRMARRS